MKRYGNLFGSIVSFQALLAASRKARRGKRYKVSTARFEHNLERELIRLHRQLTQKSYRPGPYREFKIYEPKPRKISAAPYRDRVVQHALYAVIEPVFERSMILIPMRAGFAKEHTRRLRGSLILHDGFPMC